jgi:uncharacterized membrane protein YgaE (UPF0421/DUF939 family)
VTAAWRERRLSPEELRAQAAARSRAGLRRRRESILVGVRPILHTAVAASLAWLAATELLGHPRPFFAPVAAVITLGLTLGARRRRAIEMAFGVAVGILVADLLVLGIGRGTWQIAVVTALAMAAALLVGGGPLLASQAATSAVLVATLQPSSGGFSFERFFDALTGGASALVVATLLFPVDPVTVVRRAADPVLDRLAVALDTVAEALDERDPELADGAMIEARSISLAELHAALGDARESARLSLRPGRARERLARYAEAARHLEFAVDNVRVLARGAWRAISLGDATPPDVTAALRELADAVRSLEIEDPEHARAAALTAAEEANRVMQKTGNMSALHIVGQLRSTAVDLLRASGMGRSEAVAAVREGIPAIREEGSATDEEAG